VHLRDVAGLCTLHGDRARDHVRAFALVLDLLEDHELVAQYGFFWDAAGGEEVARVALVWEDASCEIYSIATRSPERTVSTGSASRLGKNPQLRGCVRI
jgi:hypothetical protein